MSFEGKKLGKYLLKEKLGQGGMGIVFLAVQEGLNREVALKVLPEKNLAKSQDLLKRFLKEASVCAKLSHPNIIKVYDYGYEAGAYYYAMEVLRATSLEDVLKKQPIPSFDYTLRIARDMVSAFECYFPANVVHRDIKPANIMLDSSGKAILTDFGLVKDLMATGITREGAAVGTPYYMSPEQVRGQQVDGGTDIWQLGVVLYRMVAGRVPFKSEQPGEVFRQIMAEEPKPPSEHNPKVPQALENLILNCIEKDRSIRYSKVEELQADLEACRRGTVARRRDPSSGAPAEAPAREPSGQRIPRASRAMTSAQRQATVAMYVPPKEKPAWMGPAVRATLLVLLVPAALVMAWLRMRHVEYSAMDVQTKVGSRKAVVEWQSPTEYAGKIAWGEEGGAVRMAVLDSPGRLRHSVELEPLAPGKSYSYSIVFPDEKRSLAYTFQTAAAPIRPRDSDPAGGKLSLVFDTPAPAIATLSSGERFSKDAAPATSHALALDGVDLERAGLELRFADAAGENVTLGREEILAAFRDALVPAMASDLTRELDAFEIDQFLLRRIDQKLPPEACRGAISSLEGIGLEGALKGQRNEGSPRYGRFTPGDGRAAGLARMMRDYYEKQSFVKRVAKLVAIGRGIFDERRLGVEHAAHLLAAVTKLRDYDYYAAFLNIPFSIGIEGIFDRAFRVRRELGPAGSGELSQVIPGNSYWGHPYKEYQLVQRTEFDTGAIACTPPYDWKISLKDPSKWKRAELALVDVRLEPELYFKLTVNKSVVLQFRNDPSINAEAKSTRAPALAMEIDPRMLVNGENVIRVEITNTPGTRYLGLKKTNNIKSLRLVWE